MEFKHTNLKVENEYPKLVRDKIPEIVNKNEGVEVKSRILTDDVEFARYLAKKIIEESTELNDAISNGNIDEELADIFELIDNILILIGKTKEDIVNIQAEKRQRNGGFTKRILMLGKENNYDLHQRSEN